MADFSGVSAVDVLGASLRLLERNNRFISNNIANVDTPHFRPSHIDFEKSLGLALGQPRRADLRIVMDDNGHEFRNDRNSVDIETEMMQLAENTNKYNILAGLLTKKFEITKDMLTKLR